MKPPECVSRFRIRPGDLTEINAMEFKAWWHQIGKNLSVFHGEDQEWAESVAWAAWTGNGYVAFYAAIR